MNLVELEKKYNDIKQSERLINILADPDAAFYLLDKAKGQNSFQAVSILRKQLGIKKVGFSGTLDPLASGLLIMATGRATRLLDFFHAMVKSYQADIIFGQTSASYDREQEVVMTVDAQAFTETDLRKNLKKFLGEQLQTAPAFSAKKVGGQKLHMMARANKKIDLPQTNITIHQLKIVNFSYPNLSLDVRCSAGTYIRSLAHDIGKTMTTGALLSDLRRIRIGDFSVENALAWDKLDERNLSLAAIDVETVIASLDQFFGQ